MERRQLSTKEITKYTVIKDAIKGHLKANQAAEKFNLYTGKYAGFNISHFTEMLEDEEDIVLSRETVRDILLEKGSYKKRKNNLKHRSWREPKPKEGMMLQYDTSDHDPLEGRGPRIKLIRAIDDATGNVPYTRFVYEDSTEENKIFDPLNQNKI